MGHPLLSQHPIMAPPIALDQLGLAADLKMYFLNPRASPQRLHLPGSSGFARLSTRPRAGAPALVK